MESGSQNHAQNQPRLGPVGWAPANVVTSWWVLISPVLCGVLFGGHLGLPLGRMEFSRTCLFFKEAVVAKCRDSTGPAQFEPCLPPLAE